MPDKLSSDELFRLATEKTFQSLKGLSEARELIREARKESRKEGEVPGGSPTDDARSLMEQYVISMYGGDNLDRVIGYAMQQIAQELVQFEGVLLDFEGVRVKLEKITFPEGPIVGGGGVVPTISGLPPRRRM